MFFFSRMSRQSSPEQPQTSPSSPGESPLDQPGLGGEQGDDLADEPEEDLPQVDPSEVIDLSQSPSPTTPHRMSKDSEGYPTWLPKRPPPPAPQSTFQSSSAMHDAGPSDAPFTGGRRPTPRSVRIVSLQDSAYAEKGTREPTDQTSRAVPLHGRVWSRATGTAMSPTVFSVDPSQPRIPQPKFRSRGLHLELLRNPSPKSRLYFYLFPILVFAHIPIQTFFDFNTVFILFQVSKFPNPEAPGVSGSGRNWALGAAAYIACWLVWIFVVFVVYELIYSFARRWRVKRPLILPIYLSSPAFNLAAMSSYSTFCFLQHIRYAALRSDPGSVRAFLAETFYFYSQNLPTVALLLPRAGLALALLLSFSQPQVTVLKLADEGIHHRDTTFFRAGNGTLTSYARGVLIANAALTAWKVLVLCSSWIGLWALSGHGCAGICGPRYRWEEEEAEKTTMAYHESDSASDVAALRWSWKEGTRERVFDAYDFCLTVRPVAGRWGKEKGREVSDGSEVVGGKGGERFEGMEQVLAAVGFPSVPPPARRGVLSEDLFEEPRKPGLEGFEDVIPRVGKSANGSRSGSGGSGDKGEGPLMKLPYPFTGRGAQVSSKDRVPFPPSPGGSEEKTSTGEEEEQEEDGEEEVEDEQELELEEEEGHEGSEEPSSGRASGSMSSLGHPVSSRYPFQFRRPVRGTSTSMSSAATPRSHAYSHSHSQSNTRSVLSHATQSTGNRESTDSQSPRSQRTSGSDMASPMSAQSQYSSGLSTSQHSAGIPMPPRHPQQGQRGRARAGTVPVEGPASPTPVAFPRRTRARLSEDMEAFGPVESGVHGEDVSDTEEGVDEPAPEAEAAEREDVVGLLSHSAGPSPRTSFSAIRHRASTLSSGHRRSHGSRNHSHSGSGSGSASSRSRTGSSISLNVRSRTQSLMQGIGAASHSSLELVQTAIRSRANSSMARLEEDSSDGRTHSRSGSGSDGVLSTNGSHSHGSSAENYTFGHPLRTQWRPSQEEVQGAGSTEVGEDGNHSNLSVSVPSQERSERTASPLPPQRLEGGLEPAGVPIVVSDGQEARSITSSHADISTADPSFVTGPATIDGTTESSSSWGGVSHMVDRSDGTWRPA